MPDHRSQIGAVTGRHLRRRRSAAKSRAPRCRAAGARKRPGVGPPVADRSSGRLGSIRLSGALGEPSDTRGRSNASFAFPTLRRVVPQPLLKHGNTERVELLGGTVLSTGRPGLRSRSEERTNERADDRSSSRSTFAPTNNFFLFQIRTALYTNTALPRVGVERPNGPYVART